MRYKLGTKSLGVYALCAGLMDSLSGLLLMFMPEHTLKMMRVPEVSAEAAVFVSFVGAFVFSVGVLYLFGLIPLLINGKRSALGAIFLITAWVRGVICAFTTYAIVRGHLGIAWSSVPLSDGALAIFQIWAVFNVRFWDDA